MARIAPFSIGGGICAVVLAVRGGETGPRACHLTREIVT